MLRIGRRLRCWDMPLFLFWLGLTVGMENEGVGTEQTLEGWLETEGVAEANLDANFLNGEMELEIPLECFERNWGEVEMR